MRSMILTSQLPVSRWHEQIGDPTLADGSDAARHQDMSHVEGFSSSTTESKDGAHGRESGFGELGSSRETYVALLR